MRQGPCGWLDGSVLMVLRAATTAVAALVLAGSANGQCVPRILGSVDFGDILRILSAWGNKGGPEDLNGSGTVDFADLLIVLAAWGPCQP